MNKGILAGGVENGTFIAIPSFKCGNSGSTFELNNGSMIKAEIMDIPNVTFKAAGTRSLIKSTKSISTGWTTKFNGNLDIECPEGEFAKGVPANNPNYIMENSVELYIPNGSKTIIHVVNFQKYLTLPLTRKILNSLLKWKTTKIILTSSKTNGHYMEIMI